MNGWVIIFGITSLGSGVWGSTAEVPVALFASVLFGGLFMFALGAKALRRVAQTQ